MGPPPLLEPGVRVGVTSGPTRAWIDPVRYLANASTGELGARIADALAAWGAKVDLIGGPGARLPERGDVRVHPIETIHDLEERLEDLSREPEPFRVWIHAMAVLDYAPAQVSPRKISSREPELVLRLAPTPKIVGRFKDLFPAAFLVGFKLETTEDAQTLRRSAEGLRERHGCDLVVANSSPFRRPDRHTAYFLDAGASDPWFGPIVGKQAIADALVERLRTKVLPHVLA